MSKKQRLAFAGVLPHFFLLKIYSVHVYNRGRVVTQQWLFGAIERTGERLF